MLVRCDRCQQPAPVVEVNDHGRLFYGIDCPRCGLYVPHAVAGSVRASSQRGPLTPR